tara:strand:+ start:24110 stop:24970 length:861 start_codon:yes stop_codon:yes gene_type:complete
MTEFDHDMSYPSYDKPFLEMAGGRYEAGLIILHPFIKVEGHNPFETGESVSKFAGSAVGVSNYQAMVESESARHKTALQRPEPSTEKAIATISSGGTLLSSHSAYGLEPEDDLGRAVRVPWHEIVARAKLSGIEEVMGALLTSIGGMRDRTRYEQACLRLISLAEREGLYLPQEGLIQPLNVAPLAEWLGPMDQLIFQTEFEDDGTMPLKTAIDEAYHLRGSIYPQDKSKVVTVDWDSFFTLAFGTTSEIERLADTLQCDFVRINHQTEQDWWLPAASSPIEGESA